MEERKIIYVAHKYGGNDENIERVGEIVKELVNYYKKEYTFVSPLHTFGFLYSTTSYNEGFEFCKDLLMRVDELWLCKGKTSTNNWNDSTGCNREYGIACGRGIPIKYVEYINELNPNVPLPSYNEPLGYHYKGINIYDENNKLIKTIELIK